MSRKFALGFVTNPYRTVCAVKLDAGDVAWRTIKKFTGRHSPDTGKPIYSGEERVCDTFNPHSSAGSFSAASIGMIDMTPRSFEEAMRIAEACPAGSHVGAPMSDTDAKAYIAAALATV